HRRRYPGDRGPAEVGPVFRRRSERLNAFARLGSGGALGVRTSAHGRVRPHARLRISARRIISERGDYQAWLRPRLHSVSLPTPRTVSRLRTHGPRSTAWTLGDLAVHGGGTAGDRRARHGLCHPHRNEVPPGGVSPSRAVADPDGAGGRRQTVRALQRVPPSGSG